SANLIAPTAGEEQQPNYLAEAILAKAAPERLQFLWRQHTITASHYVSLPGSLDGIGFCQPLLDCPREEGGERTAQAIACGWATPGFDLAEQDCDGAPINIGEA